jgi:hypothetical protein
MIKKYEQAGYNPKYPRKIESWDTKGDIPEWLSDRAKVILGPLNEFILKTRPTSSGGMEIINSEDTAVLISTRFKDDHICWGDQTLFVLTEKQLELLYDQC